MTNFTTENHETIGFVLSRITEDFNLITGEVFEVAVRKENNRFYFLIKFENEELFGLECPVSRLTENNNISKHINGHHLNFKMDNEFLIIEGQ
jgi:hypothetical protein